MWAIQEVGLLLHSVGTRRRARRHRSALHLTSSEHEVAAKRDEGAAKKDEGVAA